MRNLEIHSIVLALIISTLIFSIYPTFSSLISQVVIKSTGQISGNEVIARSGYAEDIQAAVNTVSAAGGGTVYVPEGTFDYPQSMFSQQDLWGIYYGVVIPGGVDVIGQGSTATILNQTTSTSKHVAFFLIDGENGKPNRISGIKFDGCVVNENYLNIAIQLYCAKDFRIDHCAFEDFCEFSISSDKASGYITRGVIDHNSFDNPYKEQSGSWDWAYGIGVFGDGSWMSLSDLLGKYVDNVLYIEDNTFARCRYAVAGNNGGFYVFRYNYVTVSKLYDSWGKAGVDCHPGGDDYPGARGLEAYNNEIVTGGNDGDQAFKMRGGGGIIFNNTIRNVDTGVWLIKEDLPNDEQHYIKNLYIWSNTYVNVGTQLAKDSFYQENTHYFLYAKPDYTPYPYPHILTLEAAP